MRYVPIAILVAAATMTATCNVYAGSSSLGVDITSDREPGKFTAPKDVKYEFKAAHTFDSGVIFGGSFTYTDRAFSN